MPRARKDENPRAGRPVTGSIHIRPFKNGADASFWLRITADGQRQSRRLGRASEGWTPLLAEAERRRVVAEIEAGIYREPAVELPLEERDPTFHVWASRWLEMRTGEIEPKTHDHYEYLLRCHLLPAFHAYRLTEVTYRAVEEFKKRKVDEMRRIQAAMNAGVTLRHADGRPMKLSPKTINHAIDLLSAVLGAAARDEELDTKVNPADDRRLRVKIPKRAARDFLEADEVLSLLFAGEIFDNPVKPETARAAEEVRRLRDDEQLTWKEVAARLGRSYVTLMLEAGAPLMYVQDQVGHEDTKTTQEIYARVLRRQQRAHVGSAFNELMYGARELAFRTEEETRSGGGALLMRSPFDDPADLPEP